MFSSCFVFHAADATDKELVDLVQELEVMKRFGQHRNIINLVGCMTRDGPLYVIVEYAQHGNLRDFLRNNRPRHTNGSRILNAPAYDDLQLTQKHLVTFANEIANGMQYLASNQVSSKSFVQILLIVVCFHILTGLFKI